MEQRAAKFFHVARIGNYSFRRDAMMQKLRIVIADDQPLVQSFLQIAVSRLGHQVIGIASTGIELIDLCREREPDLVITDIHMPGMDGLAAVAELNREKPIPVIVVSALTDDAIFARAAEAHVLAFLTKPIKENDLAAAITIVMQRFKEFQGMQEDADNLRQSLQDRKTIERAKGLLMKHAGLDEPAAFKRLQKMARDRGQKLVQVAESVLSAGDAFAK